MADREERVRGLGRAVAEEIESGAHGMRLDESRRRAQEQSLGAFASRTRRPRRRVQLQVAFASAAAVLVVTIGFLFLRTEPLPFGVGGEPLEPQPPRWVQAEAERAVPVRFADGSELELRAGGSARVLESTSRSVRVGLVHGRLWARIHPSRPRRWKVEAGPFQVIVEGTVFSVSWDAARSRLGVEVTRGKVRVIGAGLRDTEIVLSAGQSLRVDRGRAITNFGPPASAHPLAPDTTGAGASRVPAAEARATHHAQPLDAGQTPPSSDKRALTPSRERADSWLALQRQGRYPEALAAARAAGLDRILKRGGAAELWALSEAARYEREGKIAARALTALLQRYPRSEQAPLGTFLLGRVQLELNRRPAEAARRFRQYLRNSPRGPLAEEALGRLIDAHARAGQQDDAQAAARRYLSRYPEGSFAEQARSELRGAPNARQTTGVRRPR